VKRLLLAAVIACAPMAAAAADLSGTWKVDGNFAAMGVTYTVTCKLAQDPSGKLSGPCDGANSEHDAATGAVTTGSDGKPALELAYDTNYQGTPVHLDYKGTAQADGSFAGTIDTGGPQGVVTATRQ